MALTFGTLLSSQGADAQKLNPSGHRPWLDVQHYAGFQRPARRAAGPAALAGRAAQRESYTPVTGRSNPGVGDARHPHGTCGRPPVRDPRRAFEARGDGWSS